MDRRKTTAIALGTVGVALIVSGMRRQQRSRPSRLYTALTGAAKPKVVPPTNVRGAVVCPGELQHLPANLAGASPGDFVAIRVANHAGTFNEVVWGLIESIHGKGKGASKLPGGQQSTAMLVRLTGSVGDTLVHTPKAELHGFDVGAKLILEDNCAWDLFRASPKVMALCGLLGREVSGKGTPATAGTVVVGEEVLIYLAPVKAGTSLSPGPGWDVPNPVWARIVRTSPSGSVLSVMLLDAPLPVPDLALTAGDEVDISRDCIFDVRPGGV